MGIFILSIIPMSFVPLKIIKTSGITPIAISQYGYINLFRRQYIVKDFGYTARIDDSTYLSIKADLMGASMVKGSNAMSMTNCQIHLLTTKTIEDITDILAKYISDRKQFGVDIIGTNCTIDIKKISAQDVLNIEMDKKIDENEILNTEPEVFLYAQDANFNIMQNNFVSNYSLSMKINDGNFAMQFSNDDLEKEIQVTFNKSKFRYNKGKIDEEITLNTDNVGDLFRNLICASDECRSYTRFFPMNVDIKMKKNDQIWHGDINSDNSGNIDISKDLIDIKLTKLDLKAENMKSEIQSSIPIYKFLKKYININQNINLSINDLKIDNKTGKNISLKYTNKDKKMNITGIYLDNGKIETINPDLKNLEIHITNVKLLDVISTLNQDLEPMILEKERDIRGDLSLSFTSGNFAFYLSKLSYKQGNQKLELNSDECVSDCNKVINFENINIFDFIDRNQLRKYTNIDNFIVTDSGERKQTALLYAQDPSVIGRDNVKNIQINLQNVTINDEIVNNARIKLWNSRKNLGFAIENADSKFIKGDGLIKVELSSTQNSKLTISANFAKFMPQKIINVLYPEAKIENTSFVIPSFAGFTGHIDLKVDDMDLPFSNLNISSDIDLGNIKGNNGVIKYNGSDIRFNLSGSLVSKPLLKFGIGIDNITIKNFIGNKEFDKMDGILTIRGDAEASGFSYSEMKKNFAGIFTGNVYNYTLNTCNLAGLSNRLINIQNISSLDVEKIMFAGSSGFKAADIQIGFSNGIMQGQISNAKNTGISMSGSCSLNLFSDEISDCSAIFNVIAQDLNKEEGGFMPLKISFAANGKLLLPQYKFNYDQVFQYKTNAISYVNLHKKGRKSS
ncbi:AsmA family protein [Candidatus Deianiraea vastatrix]|uniref:hypothetical protein n=1 Tax=Candidatus Deianiraea vastatrix TaxID=2163644 RepID=UPI0011BFBBB8|nr:hypothetical protein [Candidatus Deianiraea vastatrix]